MSTRENDPLTDEQKLCVFRAATSGFAKWYAEDIKCGMTDQQLAEALENALGIMGGRAAPGEPCVQYQGAGLKIWGGWEFDFYDVPPLFSGQKTIAMARTVYGIPDPEQRQMALF